MKSTLNKSLTWIIETESQSLIQFLDLIVVYKLRIPWMRERLNSLEEGSGTLPKIYATIPFPNLPHRDLQPFITVTVHWEKKNESDLWETTGHWLWTDTNSKTSLWATSQSRGLWRSGHQWSFNSGPSHRDPVGPKIHPVVTSPVLECIKWNTHMHIQQLAVRMICYFLWLSGQFYSSSY